VEHRADQLREPAPPGFSDFVRERYVGLVRTAFLLTGDRGRAEDLVQTALTRVYPSWDRIETPEAYVRTTMLRQWFRWSRRKWRGEVPGLLPEHATDDPAFGRVETGDAVLRALRRLDRDQRAVIVLRYWEQRSEAEIASMLGCSAGTVKSRASRALSILRTEPALREALADLTTGGAA
jgi:RNA polymerase sigma-70 factor (sigma-E family)